jgi:hypothetical protein
VGIFRIEEVWRRGVLPALMVLGVCWVAPAHPNVSAGQAYDPDAAIHTTNRTPLLDDVEGAFARIPLLGEHLTARVNGLIPKPRYRTSVRNLFGLLNHFQGIQRLPGSNHVAISGSNRSASPAELFIVRLGIDTLEPGTRAGEIVARVDLDSAMRHVGGLSLEGTVLAVPLHGTNPRRAKVVFYDVSNPEHPRKLGTAIDRPGRKAGAAAVTRLSNGHFLVAVLSAFDGRPRRLDFYLSCGPVLEDGFLKEPVTWRVAEVEARPGQEPTFSYFQTISFIRQSDNRLYLAGFHNSFASPSALPGRDYADLYQVRFPEGTIDSTAPRLGRPSIVKVANRLLRCTNGYCNLDAAAGLAVDADTESLSVYAAPGWLDGETLKITVFRGR